MPFDPAWPPQNAEIESAPFRNQFNSLKAIIDAQQNQIVALLQQLAPLVPVLTRSASGQWTLAYAGPAQAYWQVWIRSSSGAEWAESGEMRASSFPASDDDMVPGGVSWWQVKICGEDGDGNQTTPFSNIISFGPVPA